LKTIIVELRTHGVRKYEKNEYFTGPNPGDLCSWFDTHEAPHLELWNTLHEWVDRQPWDFNDAVATSDYDAFVFDPIVFSGRSVAAASFYRRQNEIGDVVNLKGGIVVCI
jgi:hypothetical protein